MPATDLDRTLKVHHSDLFLFESLASFECRVTAAHGFRVTESPAGLRRDSESESTSESESDSVRLGLGSCAGPSGSGPEPGPGVPGPEGVTVTVTVNAAAATWRRPGELESQSHPGRGEAADFTDDHDCISAACLYGPPAPRPRPALRLAAGRALHT